MEFGDRTFQRHIAMVEGLISSCFLADLLFAGAVGPVAQGPIVSPEAIDDRVAVPAAQTETKSSADQNKGASVPSVVVRSLFPETWIWASEVSK